MKPIIRDNGKNVMTTPMCGNCGKVLHYLEYDNKHGVPCYNPRVIVENFCPNCGYKVEGYKEEHKMTAERAINILEKPSVHMEVINIDGKQTIVYDSDLVEALEMAIDALNSKEE